MTGYPSVPSQCFHIQQEEKVHILHFDVTGLATSQNPSAGTREKRRHPLTDCTGRLQTTFSIIKSANKKPLHQPVTDKAALAVRHSQ
jgi:hypothetical protein